MSVTIHQFKTRAEILARYPNATESFIRRNLDPADSRANPEFQKCQENRPERSPANPKGCPTENERNYGRFDLSIELRLSNRLQDPDGALCTIMDCLSASRRRFLEAHQADTGQCGHQLAGGGIDQDNNQPVSLDDVRRILK